MNTYLQPATPGKALLVQHNQVLFHENQARSQNEQTLYNAWLQEKGAREHLKATLRNMQQQITALQTKLSIQDNINKNKINNHNQPTCLNTIRDGRRRITQGSRVDNSLK
jgi:hypothetical protein